jgi:thiol-disulfide isomerase/thioredoxin
VKPRWSGVAAILAVLVGVIVAAALALAPPTRVPLVGYTLLDGTRSSTEAWRGKVVLVNFWATDCAACIEEMPQLAATHEKFKARGYDTLAVSMRHDLPAQVARYAQSRKLPFGVALDLTGAIARGFDPVRVTPTSVLINRRGEIVGRFVGALDFTALQVQLEALLDET